MSIRFETPSLVVREFVMEDFDALYELIQQTEITDILPDWNMSEEQLHGFMRFVISSYEKLSPMDVRFLLAVEHKREKKLIGWCGVFPNDLLPIDEREVAYAMSRDYRNRGLTTEAVQAVVRYVFRNTALDHVTAIVKPFNVPSRRLLEKVGFQHVRRTTLADDQIYDCFGLERPHDLSICTRAAGRNDIRFLWEMLYLSLYVPPGAEPFDRRILEESFIQKYLKDWGRRGHIAIIAESKTREPLGAAWLRLFNAAEKGFGYVDDSIPELGIAVLPDYRGQGIGTVLMGELEARAKDFGFRSLSLSVDPQNPALGLYQRFGYEHVGWCDTSWTMKKSLDGRQ